MKYIMYVFSIGILLISGCGKSHDEKMKQVDTLSLNSGEKWVVDANMMALIRSMESDINTFNGEKPEDYTALSEKLETNLQSLITNCTMKGPAHDELHKWLLPYISTLRKLSKSKDVSTSKLQVDTARNLFNKFNKYFQ